MCDAERFARKPVEQVAAERLARREGDRVHDAVEPVPLLSRAAANSASISSSLATSQGSIGVAPNSCASCVTRSRDILVLVGEGERRALALQRLGDAVGDRAVAAAGR